MAPVSAPNGRRLSTLLVIAVGLACGGRDEGPPSSVGEGQPEASAVDAVTAVPRPDDPGVLRLGTPESSRAAMPTWARARFGHAPSASADVARAMFEAADPSPRTGAAFDRDLVACEVQTDADVPFLRGRHRRARIDVDFSWGDARESVQGPRAAGVGTTWFSATLVTLAPGDRWWLALRDGDGVHEIDTAFDGRIPLTARAEGVTLECRPVDPSARVEAVRDALWSLDKRLALLAATGGDDEPEALHDITHMLAPLAEPAADVAALVGWDDPRLARRFARRAELEARGVEQVAIANADALASAAAPDTWVGVGRLGRRLQAKVARMSCEILRGDAIDDPEPDRRPPWRCRATVSIDNGARRERVISAEGDRLSLDGPSLAFVDAWGRRARVALAPGTHVESIARSAMETLEIVLEPDPGATGLEREPPPAIPGAFELEGERPRRRLMRRAGRRVARGRLPRPAACEVAAAPAPCTGS